MYHGTPRQFICTRLTTIQSSKLKDIHARKIRFDSTLVFPTEQFNGVIQEVDASQVKPT